MTADYINAHEPIYSYLIRYFLPDLSEPHFRQDAVHEIEQDERMTYCRYMAAWLPPEPHYNEILNKLKQLCESDRKAVCAYLSELPVSAIKRQILDAYSLYFADKVLYVSVL